LTRRQVLLQRHQEAVATARTRDDQIIVYATNHHRINTSAAGTGKTCQAAVDTSTTAGPAIHELQAGRRRPLSR
jgi:hypothetical protein